MSTIKFYLLTLGLLLAGGAAVYYRDVLPDLIQDGFFAGISGAVLWAGYRLFRRVQHDQVEHEYLLLQNEQLVAETQRIQTQTQAGLLEVHARVQALSFIYPTAQGYFPMVPAAVHGSMQYLQLPQYAGQQVVNATDLEPMPELQRKEAPRNFRQLFEDGIIQAALKENQMILGYVDGQLRRVTWLDLYSCGIGGVSGSGKSTTIRFLLFQGILSGAKFVMIDPHIGDAEESLAAQFRMFPDVHQLSPCNAQSGQVLKRVEWLSKEYARREAKGIKGPRLILVIDEFNEVMRNKEVKEALSELLLNIEQGGRKFGMFAMLIGQRWSAQDLGGADIRTSLPSRIAHRFGDEDQAKKLIGSKYGPLCLELPTGEYLFRDTNGRLSRVTTPVTYAEDGAVIQSLLVGYEGLETTTKTSETSVKPVLHLTAEEPVFGHETSAESSDIRTLARQIITLQAQGKQKPEIMRQLWGVSPGASKEYTTAQNEFVRAMQYIETQMV